MARGSARFTTSIPRFIYFYTYVSFALGADYGIPIEIKVWDTGRTPLAHMVDITNGFGLKVLAEHNFLNDNNIAFSPYGLMGILVALYEGVDGESSYQIQRGMQLPWNRNVMRIGFRDIHRTLKTYFVPEEGFLAGLALNNENVTFNESYKKILRFYGFDLDNEQIPTLTPDLNNTISMSTSTEPSPLNTAAAQPPATMSSPTTMTSTENVSTMSTKEETTMNADAETIEDIDPRAPTSTSVTSSAASNSESTTMRVTTIDTTTTQSTIGSQSTTKTNNQTPTVSSTNQMTSITTSIRSEAATTATAAITIETTTIATSPPSSITTNGLPDSDNLSTREMTSISTSDSTTEDSIDSSTMTTMQITNQETGSTVTQMITETSEAFSPSTTLTTSTSEGEQTESTTTPTLETLERRKRSLVDYPIFTKPPSIDDYLIYRSFEIPSETVNTDINTKMFLVNGLRNVQVSYMNYDTVLEHAYLPHLEASALRLPLDSDRYYLLVVLPSRRGDVELGRLLARMARESDLSDVYAALRPRRVRAIVPSFTVKGHVTLTTDLQKVGIRDVFEPRQHDFTPMTRQPGVYVRSIEQAVSVAIRKYQPDDHKKNRYANNRNRVFFSATYPFLYFVMDSSIHVALMAGKMVDPLNTRIL